MGQSGQPNTQSPAEMNAMAMMPHAIKYMEASKAKAAEFGPGGSQSADKMWASIEPYYSKAIQDANEYGGAQLGALRGYAGSTLVEQGVAPGSQLNSAFLSSIAPLIAELAKFKGGISATQGAAKQGLLESNAQMQLGGQQVWGNSFNNINNLIAAMSKTTPLGDIMGGIQTGTNTVKGILELIKGF